MLTNIDLYKICDFYHIKLHGIYMKDELPSLIQDGNYIINLESSTEGNGKHWTCLIIHNQDAFFFDPFGASPSIPVVYFCKGHRLAFNNWIIQNIKSSNCGWYCVALLLFLSQHNITNRNFYALCNMFSNGFYSNTSRNDPILKEIFQDCPYKKPL